MGVFDYVQFYPPMVCHNCSTPLGEFQTKDSPDQCLYHRVIENKELLSDVQLRWVHADGSEEMTSYITEDDPAMTWRVYTRCDECDYWNEYRLVIVNKIVVQRTWVDSPINSQLQQ